MTKPSRKLLAPIAALGAVSLAAIGGSASASPSAGGEGAGGRVRVYEVAPSLTSNASVVATGAITDSGTNHQGVGGGGTINRIVFAKGDLEVSTAGLTGAAPAVDPRNCSFKRTLSGTVPIVNGSGTGAYAGVSGTFRVTVKVVGIFARSQSGGCDTATAPVGGISWVRGVGTVSYS